jgi:predicted ATPase
VDVCYEARVRLVVSAAALPHQLFRPVFRDEEQATARPQRPAHQSHAHPHGHHQGSSSSTPAAAAAATAAAQRRFDEAFAFDRTVSRLLEMQSAEYAARTAWTPTPAERTTCRSPPRRTRSDEC